MFIIEGLSVTADVLDYPSDSQLLKTNCAP
jgi:hypothetical protein